MENDYAEQNNIENNYKRKLETILPLPSPGKYHPVVVQLCLLLGVRVMVLFPLCAIAADYIDEMFWMVCWYSLCVHEWRGTLNWDTSTRVQWCSLAL